jgi:hypothetical protein
LFGHEILLAGSDSIYYSICVTRDHYKTVTNKESFVILIATSPEEAMGEATFLPESMPGVVSPVPVRPVTSKDVKDAAAKLKGVDAKQFDALLALRGALEARDELALDDARGRMERVYQLRERELTQYRKSPENEETQRYWAELIESLRLGPKAKQNPSRLLSFDVSRTVGQLNTNIVLWWVDRMRRFIPAIFCVDVKTALYLHTFFIAPTGGPGFRSCLYDGEQFFQDRPNQEYCCPAHREAHRVARFRDNKRRKTEERGKHHGAQKTR